MARPVLRPAPLPRFAISFQRLPSGQVRTVVVESFSLDGAAQAIRRYLGDDGPRPHYRLCCDGQVLASPFASREDEPEASLPFTPASARRDDDFV